MTLLRSLAALLTAVLVTVPALAVAATNEPISVKVNMARILRISAPAATVIIGNPGVADVTIQDPQTLVLTGKSYGSTNLIVLDSSGNPVADTMVSVVQATGDTVTVYNARPAPPSRAIRSASRPSRWVTIRASPTAPIPRRRCCSSRPPSSKAWLTASEVAANPSGTSNLRLALPG